MFSPASAAITQVASLPLDPLETRPVKLVLTHDDSSVFPVDDEDYDVFFDDLQIEQAPSLSHLAFGLTDGVHFRSRCAHIGGSTLRAREWRSRSIFWPAVVERGSTRSS
jgi:hypothetical protein